MSYIKCCHQNKQGLRSTIRAGYALFNILHFIDLSFLTVFQTSNNDSCSLNIVGSHNHDVYYPVCRYVYVLICG